MCALGLCSNKSAVSRRRKSKFNVTNIKQIHFVVHVKNLLRQVQNRYLHFAIFGEQTRAIPHLPLLSSAANPH